MRESYEQMYTNKLDNLDEMDKFLEKHKLPKLTQEEIENLNRPMPRDGITNFKTSPKQTKSLNSKYFTGEL